MPVRDALGGVDTTNRQAVVDFYNAVYVPALAVANGWTGNTTGCVAGTTSAAYANATMDMVNYHFPQAVGKRFGAIVESLGTTPAQVVVEQAMYWDALGQAWAAGTNALATRLR